MRSVPGVLVDRVNIGGNETGQQSNFASKGTRPQDAVWTIDGINITDMAATGASPTYFNYDNFEEIQVSTAGQDIKQPTGGMGLNLVVKRGTNQFHGGFRGYFDNDAMESANVPDELRAAGRDRGHLRPQQADLRLRLRPRRTDRPRQGVVLRLVLAAGRPAGAPRRRARRPHAAEEPEREAELAGDEEGHGQLPLLRRLQDQGRPQPRHRRHPVRRADARPSTRTTPTPTCRSTACGRSPTIASSRRTCSCRRSTPTTTPASCSTRWAGSTQQAGRSFTIGAVVRLGRTRASTSGRRRSSTSTCNSFLSAMGASARRQVRLRLSQRPRRPAARCGRATGSSRSRTRRPTCARRSSAQGFGGNRADLSRLLRRRHDFARSR